MRLNSVEHVQKNVDQALPLIEFDAAIESQPLRRLRLGAELILAAVETAGAEDVIFPDRRRLKKELKRIRVGLTELRASLLKKRIKPEQTNKYLRIFQSDLAFLKGKLETHITELKADLQAEVQEVSANQQEHAAVTINRQSSFHELKQVFDKKLKEEEKKEKLKEKIKETEAFDKTGYVKEVREAVKRYADVKSEIPTAIPKGQEWVLFQAPVYVWTDPTFDKKDLERAHINGHVLHPGVIFEHEVVVGIDESQHTSVKQVNDLIQRVVKALKVRTNITYIPWLEKGAEPSSRDHVPTPDRARWYMPGSRLSYYWLMDNRKYRALGSFSIDGHINFPFIEPKSVKDPSSPEKTAEIRGKRLQLERELAIRAKPFYDKIAEENVILEDVTHDIDQLLTEDIKKEMEKVAKSNSEKRKENKNLPKHLRHDIKPDELKNHFDYDDLKELEDLMKDRDKIKRRIEKLEDKIEKVRQTIIEELKR